MRYYSNSKSLQISLGLSILLHLFFILFLSAPRPVKKMENPLTSVDFISSPKDEQLTIRPPSPVKGKTKIKKGSPDASEAVKVTEAVKAVEAAPQQEKTIVPDAKVEQRTTEESPVARPVEVTKKTAIGPNLIPPLDRMAKLDEEKGKGGQDEETISLDTIDERYTSYTHGVKLKIEGVWRYPEAAKRAALEGKGLISFTIERDGTVSDIHLVASSGYTSLDEAIIKAIKDASAFNPMQENMRVKRLKILAGFEYNLVVQRIWGR